MMKVPFMFLVLFIMTLCYSQEEINEHKNQIYQIAKDNPDKSTKIGTFKMLNKKIKLDDSVTIVLPKIVKLQIHNGFIKDITVTMDNGEIYTNDYSISLIHYYERLNDKLSNIHPKKRERHIRLGSVLMYYCEMGKNFTPDNVVVILPITKQIKKGKHNIIVDDISGRKKIKTEGGGELDLKDTIIYTSNINLNDGITNLIDYRIYSDFLGLIEETSNGIVNFEAKINIPVNPNNLFNSNFYVFKTLNPYVRYSRFDKEDRVIDIRPESLPLYVINDEMQLIQKSFISSGGSLDLLSFNPKHSFLEFNIPFLASFNLAEIIPDIKENITSASYGGGIEIKINRSDNFGINFGYYIHKLIHLYNVKYKIQEIEPFNYYNLNAEVFFYGGNKSDALFLRFNHTSVFGDSNNFFQFQIGYKSGINFNK